MDLTEYQRLAMRTAPNLVPQDERQLLIWTVAMAGEVGEFCNMIKKKVGHGHRSRRRRWPMSWAIASGTPPPCARCWSSIWVR